MRLDVYFPAFAFVRYDALPIDPTRQKPTLKLISSSSFISSYIFVFRLNKNFVDFRFDFRFGFRFHFEFRFETVIGFHLQNQLMFHFKIIFNFQIETKIKLSLLGFRTYTYMALEALLG